MAAALVNVAAINPTAENELQLSLDVIFVGSDVPGATGSNIVCTFPGDAQPAAIRAAMSNAVAVEAANLGFACAGANMSLPTFQKG